jgi:Outer membrane protein beta-barrel domain
MHNPKLSENEVQRFEKEVQQKMEQLEFSPSAAVWENVARAVRVEKKRRVPFFWLFFLPALLLVGGTGIYLMTGQSAKGRNKSSGQTVALPSSQPGNNPVVINDQPAGDGKLTQKDLTGKDLAGKDLTGKDLTQKNAITDNPQATADQPANREPASAQSNISRSNAGSSNAGHTHAALHPGKSEKNNQATIPTPGDNPSSVDRGATSPAKDVTSRVKGSTNRPKGPSSLDRDATNRTRGTTSLAKGLTSLGSTSLPKNSTSGTQTEADAEPGDSRTLSGTGAGTADPATNPLWAANHLHPVDIKTRDAIHAAALTKNPAITKPRLSPKRSWEAGFTGGIGISSINQTLFKSASVTASDSRYLSAAPVPVTGSSSQTYISKIKPDLSFWAGIVLQKPLSNSFAVSVGLNLHYYSTKVSTGDKVVNNASGYYYSPASSLLSNIASQAPAQSYPYYAAGDNQSFINRYYFLEIPGAVQWQISHLHNLPLFWEVGGSVSYLMSANAIYYNTKAGVYYKDGQVSNKTQFNLSTALMMSIPLKGLQMQVGPQVQYGVTSLLNTGGSGGQHFLYGGVKLVLFPGKWHKTIRRFSQEQ